MLWRRQLAMGACPTRMKAPRPHPLVYFLVGAPTLALLSVAAVVALQLPFPVLIALLGTLLTGAAFALILIAGYRLFYKRVPERYAGVIWKSQGRECVVFPGGSRAFVLPWEKLEIIDLREKLFDRVFNCVTRDRVRVAIRVTARWQIDERYLENHLSIGIDPPTVLEQLIGACLNYEIISRTLEQAQDDARLIAFRIDRRVGDYLYGAPLFNLMLDHTRIVSITLPAGITAVAEQVRQLDLERQLARHQRLVEYANRVAETQANAQELRALDAALQDTSPLALAYASLLQFTRKRHAGAPH